MIRTLVMVSGILLATGLESGGIFLINKKDSQLKLKLKKYSLILLGGNILMMLVSQWKAISYENPVLWYFCLFTYLFCLTIYDLKYKELPDCWHILPMLCYAGFWIIGIQPVPIVESGIMLLVFVAILGIIFLLRREAIGVGDIKLLILCAGYAGFSGIGIVVRGLMLAFVYSLIMLLLKKATAKSELPFVPFLLAGALLM